MQNSYLNGCRLVQSCGSAGVAGTGSVAHRGADAALQARALAGLLLFAMSSRCMQPEMPVDRARPD